MKLTWMAAGIIGAAAIGCAAPPEGDLDRDQRVTVEGRTGSVSQASSEACFETSHDGAKAWIDENCGGNGGGGGASSPPIPPDINVCAALGTAVAFMTGAALTATTATGACATGMLVTLGVGEPLCLVPAAGALVTGAIAALGGALMWALCENVKDAPIPISIPTTLPIPTTPPRPIFPTKPLNPTLPIVRPGNCQNACPADYLGPLETTHAHWPCTGAHQHWYRYNQNPYTCVCHLTRTSEVVCR